jgi:YfiR/HmsC-like
VAFVQASGMNLVSAQGSSPNEYAVKAAFLFHFAQFVEWPEGALSEANSPLVYCTIGEDPFQGALEASFKGKVIGTHPLQVRHLKEASEAQGCHVVFIGKAMKRKRISEELASLKRNPVLTVGETNQFVEDSGMIGFCVAENKIRFDINLEAAESARLKISARLLTLAKTVIGKPKRD